MKHFQISRQMVTLASNYRSPGEDVSLDFSLDLSTDLFRISLNISFYSFSYSENGILNSFLFQNCPRHLF